MLFPGISRTDLAGAGFNFLAKSKIMKRWAVFNVLLYALALLILTAPVLLIAFGGWGKNGVMGWPDVSKIYLNWGYWLWLAMLVTGQMLLLLLPINIAERRLPARRALKIPIIVTAFFLANLCLAGIFSILCAIFLDGAFNLLDLLSLSAIFKVQSASVSNWGDMCGMILTLVSFWVIWAVVFRSFSKLDAQDTLLKRATRWLLRGSILELLVAVPSHVIVRRRDDCCAPAGTFWGIATGLSVMLLCFGPGVFFLFVERCRKLKPKSVERQKL
jgi:hypothetical protein